MTREKYPRFLAERLVTNEEALKAVIKSGSSICSGFATSEPYTFFTTIWDHIQREDLHDITFRQGLFMAPHRVLVGDALSSKGMFSEMAGRPVNSVLGNLARRANAATKKVEGLRKLVGHFRELQERRIKFVPAFIGAANNMTIPSNPITLVLYPDFVGRNPSRMGIVDMQSVHFADAVDAMAYHEDGSALVDVMAVIMTPPDENGEMSHGVANGATGDMLEMALREDNVKIILYLNPNYPFTCGFEDAGNTVHVDVFKEKAAAGKLFVVEDNAKIPGLPGNAFDVISEAEDKIAEHLVNHMEANRDLTYGRAIQVGIGGTGVLAIRKLRESSWTGRSYTEMLEPFTLDLFHAGKIAGTHFIRRDGTRTQLDGKLVCTFSLGTEDGAFYQALDRNPELIVASAARVVVSEAFYYGLGINNILALDFQGHVNSGGRDKNHYSGIGGAATIVRGLARGGVAYLVLKSTHRTPEGKLRSSIFPFLPEGTPISMIGPDLMGTREGARFYLVTEFGVVRINGMSQERFIRNVISVAHPMFQDWLKKQAYEEFRIRV